LKLTSKKCGGGPSLQEELVFQNRKGPDQLAETCKRSCKGGKRSYGYLGGIPGFQKGENEGGRKALVVGREGDQRVRTGMAGVRGAQM